MQHSRDVHSVVHVSLVYSAMSATNTGMVNARLYHRVYILTLSCIAMSQVSQTHAPINNIKVLSRKKFRTHCVNGRTDFTSQRLLQKSSKLSTDLWTGQHKVKKKSALPCRSQGPWQHTAPHH